MCEIKMGIEFDILESGDFWINIYRNRKNNIYIYEWGPNDYVFGSVICIKFKNGRRIKEECDPSADWNWKPIL